MENKRKIPRPNKSSKIKVVNYLLKTTQFLYRLDEKTTVLLRFSSRYFTDQQEWYPDLNGRDIKLLLKSWYTVRDPCILILILGTEDVVLYLIRTYTESQDVVVF